MRGERTKELVGWWVGEMVGLEEHERTALAMRRFRSVGQLKYKLIFGIAHCLHIDCLRFSSAMVLALSMNVQFH